MDVNVVYIRVYCLGLRYCFIISKLCTHTMLVVATIFIVNHSQLWDSMLVMYAVKKSTSTYKIAVVMFTDYRFCVLYASKEC